MSSGKVSHTHIYTHLCPNTAPTPPILCPWDTPYSLVGHFLTCDRNPAQPLLSLQLAPQLPVSPGSVYLLLGCHCSVPMEKCRLVHGTFPTVTTRRHTRVKSSRPRTRRQDRLESHGLQSGDWPCFMFYLHAYLSYVLTYEWL